jgi:hypothetical protein
VLFLFQNYVQALQRKACLPGESSTLQSDATHLTILPADQAQLAALTESEDDSRSFAGMDRWTGALETRKNLYCHLIALIPNPTEMDTHIELKLTLRLNCPPRLSGRSSHIIIIPPVLGLGKTFHTRCIPIVFNICKIYASCPFLCAHTYKFNSLKCISVLCQTWLVAQKCFGCFSKDVHGLHENGPFYDADWMLELN